MLTDWCEFLNIEKEYGLNQLEIEGCNYWQYGRSELMGYFTSTVITGNKPLEFDKREVLKNRFLKAWRLVLFLIRSRFEKERIPYQCDILFVSALNRINYKEKAYNPFVDPIMELYENSVLLEPSYRFRKHAKNIYSKNCVCIDYYEANAIIAYCLHRLTHDYNEKLSIVEEQLAEPIEKMCKLFGVDSVPKSIYYNMVDCITRRKVYRKFCRDVLEQLSPKAIVETCHYSFENLVINEVAFEMGIPTIELQHGSAGKGHAAYNYAEGVFVKQFPTYFFAFSRYWISRFSLPISDRCIFSVGSPYKEKRASEVCPQRENGKRVILFLSENREFSVEFVAIAIELNRLIDKDKYEIVIKLHPSEYCDWKGKYKDVLHTDIRVIDSNHPELYELFARSEYQVCAFGSTTIFEGLLLGLKTFIYTKVAGPEYLNLCSSGYAKGFTTAGDLFEKIMNSDNMVNSVEFWESDSLNKMKAAIDSIVCKE